jgi:hypothetical protein
MLKARVLGLVGIVALAGSVAGVLAAQTPASPALDVTAMEGHFTNAGKGGRFTAAKQ